MRIGRSMTPLEARTYVATTIKKIPLVLVAHFREIKYFNCENRTMSQDTQKTAISVTRRFTRKSEQ